MKFLIIPNTDKFKKEYCYNYNESIGNLEFLSIGTSVIITIGKNNSRKSRFLRNILTEESYLMTSGPITKILLMINRHINKLLSETEDIFFNHRILLSSPIRSTKYDTSRIGDYIEYLKENNIKPYLINKDYLLKIRNSTTQLLIEFSENNLETSNKYLYHFYLAISALINYLELLNLTNIVTIIEFNYRGKTANKRTELLDSDFDLLNLLKEYLSINKSIISPNKIYIPTLRGSVILYYINKASEVLNVNTNAYETTVRKNYNLDEKITVSTGLNLYGEIKRLRNSRREIRDEFESFENFLKVNFFDGNHVDIVSLEEESIIHIYIEGESDREMFNLGDGIQSLIILLYPIFIAPKKSWIFIEEPELNLHPGLQSLFLSTLMHNDFIVSKDLKFFISTHSNHILDSILTNKDKCNIFSFEKLKSSDTEQDNKSLIKEVLSPDANLLNMIGVHNSSVLLANVTIWVEGITDRKCIKAYLDSYAKHLERPILIEGYHYAFIEYAGSNLKHFMFDINADDSIEFIKSMSLSNRIYLIADKDLEKEDKHESYFKLNNDIFKYQHTGGLEIENTLSPSVINKILNNILGYNLTFTIKLEDYEQKKIGKYLTWLIKKHKLTPPKLESDSGSLETYYKNKFADFVYEQSESNQINWSMFKENTHAEALAMNIYNFITYHNSSSGC